MLISRPIGPSQWVLQGCMMPPTPDFPSFLPAPHAVQLQPVGVLLSWVYNCLSLQPLTVNHVILCAISLTSWIKHALATLFHRQWKILWTIRCYFLSSLSSVQLLNRVRLFETPWIAARQASLSITNSRSLLRLTSIESVMPSSHLILCRPLLPAPSPSQHQSLFQWVNSSHEVAKVLEFQL